MPFISDSATWVAVGVAIGAGSLAFIGALIVLLVVIRGRRSSYAAVAQLLRESLARTEGLHGDLTRAPKRPWRLEAGWPRRKSKA